MVQKTYVELIDDIDGQEADETVEFALDGVLYEIDLSTENAEALREELRVYVENARREAARKIRTTVGKEARTSAGVQTAATRERNQHIRRWASTNGIYVSNFGRIPGEAVAAFEKNEEASASKRHHRKSAG